MLSLIIEWKQKIFCCLVIGKCFEVPSRAETLTTVSLFYLQLHTQVSAGRFPYLAYAKLIA